jgi:hypothetical protein
MHTVRPARNGNQILSKNDGNERCLSQEKIVATRPALRRAQTVPAAYVKAILFDEKGPLSREQLIAYSQTSLLEEEIRPIPRTWPAELISSQDVILWSDALVHGQKRTYKKSGEQAYAEAVMQSVFPDKEGAAPNLPGKLMPFCLLLDKQVIGQCQGRGLTAEELYEVRFRVQVSFVFGRIFIPHLRPFTLRNELEYKNFYQIDTAIIRAGEQKISDFFEQILNMTDQRLNAEQSQQRRTKPSLQEQIATLIGEDYREKIKPAGIDYFHQIAARYLQSEVRDKRVLIKCFHILFAALPGQQNQVIGERWKTALDFIHRSRNRIDKLTIEAKQRFVTNLFLIAVPDRLKQLKLDRLQDALEHAERMMPTLGENAGDDLEVSD